MKGEVMSERFYKLRAEVCRILGSPTRIKIIEELSDGEKAVGELSEILGLRQANVSQHLSIMRSKGVLKTRKEGTSIYYSISNPKIIQACNLMKQVLLDQLKENEELTTLINNTSR
jgi:ArsR family transcriptional regulator